MLIFTDPANRKLSIFCKCANYSKGIVILSGKKQINHHFLYIYYYTYWTKLVKYGLVNIPYFFAISILSNIKNLELIPAFCYHNYV